MWKRLFGTSTTMSSTSNSTSKLGFRPEDFPLHSNHTLSLTSTQETNGGTLKPKQIKRVFPSGVFTEGGGFQVKRPFPTRMMAQLDPFLMLDHLGPKLYGPGEFPGAPAHPHRGFETVSYFLAGQNRHTDSHGHSGITGPGYVQWMTAGAGVIHDERPTPEFDAVGGIVEGFQIWVNLPQRLKMKTPRYQDYKPDQIPKITVTYPEWSTTASTWVNVIAGEAFGVKSVITTETPLSLIHYILQPGARVIHKIPEAHKDNWNAAVYIVKGTGTIGGPILPTDQGQAGEPAKPGDLVEFDRGSQEAGIVLQNPANTSEPLSLLVLGGVPLDEPIARRGPFVMNTQEELVQAFRDYSEGRFNQIPPEILGE